MLKNILPYVKYPYATGFIAVIWLGTLAFFVIDNELPIIFLVVIDSMVSIAILRGSMK